MTKSELKRKFASIRKQDARLCDAMIAAGRGNERPSEYLRKDDALSLKARELSSIRSGLEYEAARLFGPQWVYYV